MSIFIVGDVHGNYKSLTSSLEKLGCDVNADTIIFVGDVVDRGKENAKVVNFIAEHIMWPTQREYDARKRMRNERLAKYRANDESTRYAWGVYCCFHIVRISQKYSCKYTHKNR